MYGVGSKTHLPVSPTHEPSSKRKKPANVGDPVTPLGPDEAAGKNAPGARSFSRKMFTKFGLSKEGKEDKEDKKKSATTPKITKKPDEVRDSVQGSGTVGSTTKPYYHVPYEEHRASLLGPSNRVETTIENKLPPFDFERIRDDPDSPTPERLRQQPLPSNAQTVRRPASLDAPTMQPASPPSNVFATYVPPSRLTQPFPEIRGSDARAFHARRRDSIYSPSERYRPTGENYDEGNPPVSPMNEDPPELHRFPYSGGDRREERGAPSAPPGVGTRPGQGVNPQARVDAHSGDDYDDNDPEPIEAPSRAAPAQQYPQPRPRTVAQNVLDEYDQMSPEDRDEFVRLAQQAEADHPNAARQPLQPGNPFLTQLMDSMQGQSSMTKMNLALMEASTWQGMAIQQATTSNHAMLSGNMLAGLGLKESYDNAKRLIG